jgi:rubrerythrin
MGKEQVLVNETKLAAPELATVEIDEMNRSSFVLKSALAVGAVYGSWAVGPFVRQALAQELVPGGGEGDVGILNFALTLEYLEAEFYRRGLELDLGGGLRPLAEEFGAHEQEHVDALTSTIADLGGTPVAAPTVTFPMRNQAQFLELAQTFEDTGVGAYNGAAPLIESKDVLAAAGGIVQVEARHAAAIRLLAKANPAPAAFDEALEPAAVLAAVKPFIKG